MELLMSLYLDNDLLVGDGDDASATTLKKTLKQAKYKKR